VRTTIEIRDEQRAKLLKLAGERGEKGFSHLVQEALDKYLDEARGRTERVAAARAVLGSLDDAGAAEMRAAVAKIRERWR
jgi:hypothetical protein